MKHSPSNHYTSNPTVITSLSQTAETKYKGFSSLSSHLFFFVLKDPQIQHKENDPIYQPISLILGSHSKQGLNLSSRVISSKMFSQHGPFSNLYPYGGKCLQPKYKSVTLSTCIVLLIKTVHSSLFNVLVPCSLRGMYLLLCIYLNSTSEYH